jgi:hypothetical protein
MPVVVVVVVAVRALQVVVQAAIPAAVTQRAPE